MSFWIMLIIMGSAALIGGLVNFLLPSNQQDGKFLKPWWNCVVLGFGATLLVPLFLELAQSKLMDNIHFDWFWEASVNNNNLAKKVKADTVTITLKYDSANKLTKADTTHSNKNQKDGKTDGENSNDGGKNYLLWAAYCLLAAAAGFRFINMLINNVVKDQKINQLESKNEALTKVNEMRTANSQISQQQEHEKVRTELIKEKQVQIREIAAAGNDAIAQIDIPVIPELPSVKHPDDPQKGRFGGEPEKNHRRLSADVKPSGVPGFYRVKLWVESTDPANHPLDADVIYYVHDSFSPSVFTYKPDEFIDGKAREDEILSYGAFTVGVITDNGKTMLELDLSENPTFPKEFRER